MSGEQPDPQLLPSGDLLVPQQTPEGEWRMYRMDPSNKHYISWLEDVRRIENHRPGAPVGAIIIGVLLPIVGVVWAIVLMAKGRGSHGAAVLIASVIGWLLYIALFGV
jgi:hypothetical protein